MEELDLSQKDSLTEGRAARKEKNILMLNFFGNNDPFLERIFKSIFNINCSFKLWEGLPRSIFEACLEFSNMSKKIHCGIFSESTVYVSKKEII